MHAYSQSKQAISYNYYNKVILSSRKASEFVFYRNPITIYYYSYSCSVDIDRNLL